MFFFPLYSLVESTSPNLLTTDNNLERSFFIRMKSTLTKRGVHIKSSGYKVSFVLWNIGILSFIQPYVICGYYVHFCFTLPMWIDKGINYCLFAYSSSSLKKHKYNLSSMKFVILLGLHHIYLHYNNISSQHSIYPSEEPFKKVSG